MPGTTEYRVNNFLLAIGCPFEAKTRGATKQKQVAIPPWLGFHFWHHHAKTGPISFEKKNTKHRQPSKLEKQEWEQFCDEILSETFFFCRNEKIVAPYF